MGQDRQVNGFNTPMDSHGGEDVDPAEVIGEFLQNRSPSTRYHHVPPAGLSMDTTGGGAPEPKKAKSVLDTSAQQQAYATPLAELDNKTPQQIFEEFCTKVLRPAAEGGEHGRTVAEAIASDAWRTKLIRATIAIQDQGNFEQSPKAIKELIKSGAVPAEHAALMWFARDMLVHESLGVMQAQLKAKHPGWTFHINVLDSGSYGSIGSDIDKTLHLTAWDADGRQVVSFGPGGKVLGADISAFIKLAFDAFDHVGSRSEYGAKNSIAKSLDTEFFTSDTLPKRFARAATHTSNDSPINRAAAELKQHFANLQRNPGPSYQFIGTVMAQVVGRTVEQDAALRAKLDQLDAQRGGLAELSSDQKVAHVLDEALAATHAPAVLASEDGSGELNIRAINVADFLERNNLSIRYDQPLAAENAAGNYEKLIHKVEATRKNGQFRPEKYDLYLNDIAKYGDRSFKDLATFRFQDDDPSKPPVFGEFSRRYGPEGARERFHLDSDPPNMRAYTEEAHRQLFTESLERVYAAPDSPDRRVGVQSDVALFWAVNRANENALALKADPDLQETLRENGKTRLKGYPVDWVLGRVIEWIERDDPKRFGLTAGMTQEERQARRIEVAKELHVESAERATAILAAGHLEQALDMWLRSPDDEIARILTNERNKLRAAKLERDRLIRQFNAPGTEENETRRRQLASLNERIERLARLVETMVDDPADTKARVQMTGRETLRRLFFLFKRGGYGATYERMTGRLPDAHRRDVRIMERVWTVQSEQADRARLARTSGIRLSNLGGMTRDVASRLAHSYGESCGFDVEAMLKRTRLDVDAARQGANAPGRVVLRYMHHNYMNLGGVNSALGLLRVAQQAERLPLEARLELLGQGVATELAAGAPGVGQVFNVWMGYEAGNNVQMAGASLGMLSDVITRLSPEAAGSALAQSGSTASIVLAMMRVSVELYGYEAFAPVRDHFFQLVFKGYVDELPAGFFFRVGTHEVDARIPVTPIIDLGAGYDFLYLKADWAQQYLDDLGRAGQREAAAGLLHLAGLDENMATPIIREPVMIDLRSDFAELTRAAESMGFDRETVPAGLASRLYLARAFILKVYRRQQALKSATLARIDDDRKLRRHVPGHRNMWILASRENLGVALDDQFQRQAELLNQSLNAVPDARDTLADEARKTWEHWRAVAPSHEGRRAVYQQFLEVMSPRKVCEKHVAGLKTRIGELDKDSDAGKSLVRRLASMKTFEKNSYMNTITPTEPYRRDAASVWYEKEVARWREFITDIPDRAGRNGADAMVLLADAQRRLREMQREQASLSAGFVEADAIVAPKIAQLLLMHWLEGAEPFNNDVHAAVKFVWYDAEVQSRLRRKLVMDMTRSRQLIPHHRALAAGWSDLMKAALGDVEREYARLSEDRIQQAFRESLELAEARADARATPLEMPGEIELHVEPYLKKTDTGLDVAVDCRVDHEIYRAVDVRVGYAWDIIPWTQAESVLGADVWRDALDRSGLDAKDVLFVVRVRAGVTRAEPLAGHDSYENLPQQQVHLLLVRGTRPEPPEERIVASRDVQAFPIKPGAPDDFPIANTIDYCDPERELMEYDRVAVFFTPPHDVSEPLKERDPFLWEVLGPNGDTVASGSFAPELDNVYPLPLAKEGSPGRCVTVLNLWVRHDNPDPAKAESGPGTYTLRTVAGAYGSTATFGQGEERSVGRAPIEEDLSGETKTVYAEWEDIGTFEVKSVRLHFQGFVMESAKGVSLPNRGYTWEGELDVADPRVNGSTVALRAKAWVRKADRSKGPGRRPEDKVYRAGTTVTIEFPRELRPGHEKMGEIHACIVPGERDEYYLTAGMHLMIPTTKLPPDRHLVNRGPVPAPWASHGALSTKMDYGRIAGPWEQKHFLISFRRLDGEWVWERLPPPEYSTRKEATEFDGRITLLAGKAGQLAGEPERSMVGHLYDPDTKWVIPVFVNLTDCVAISDRRRSLVMKTYGYAIYAAVPGTYDGPAPTGKPSAGDGQDGGAGAGEGERIADRGDQPRSDPDRGGEGGGQPRRDPDRGREGDGGGMADTGDPSGRTGDDERDRDGRDPGGGLVNPSDPKVAALIRQWIDIAKPPENAVPGNNLRYTYRGNKIGTTVDGIIRSDHETGAFDPVFLWTSRRTLDSVNHGTMEEYVLARLLDESTAGFAGRYGAVKNLEGEPLKKAMDAVAAAGFKHAVALGTPARTAEEEGTIESQTPPWNRHLRRGQTVNLTVHSKRKVVTVPVPDVREMDLADAMQVLRSDGFEVKPKLLRGAPDASEASKVKEQEPSAGERVAAGSVVVVKAYGRYIPPGVFVPSVCRMTLADAKTLLQSVGLKVKPEPLGRTRDRSKAGMTASQDPRPGATVPPGSAVKVGVWGDYAAETTQVAATPRVERDRQGDRRSTHAAGEHARTVPRGGEGAVSTARRVPPCKTLTYADAVARVRRAGLVPKKASETRPAPSQAQVSRVWQQVPVPGAEVTAGAAVRLWVYGNTAPRKVKVPNCVRHTSRDAANLLRRAGLRAAPSSNRQPAPSGDRVDRVWKQDPPAQAEVAPGTQVRLFVYGSVRSTTRRVPRCIGMTYEKAAQIVRKAGLNPIRPGDYRPAPSKDQTNRVFYQLPNPGTEVMPGNPVCLWAYQAPR